VSLPVLSLPRQRPHPSLSLFNSALSLSYDGGLPPHTRLVRPPSGVSGDCLSNCSPLALRPPGCGGKSGEKHSEKNATAPPVFFFLNAGRGPGRSGCHAWRAFATIRMPQIVTEKEGATVQGAEKSEHRRPAVTLDLISLSFTP